MSKAGKQRKKNLTSTYLRLQINSITIPLSIAFTFKNESETFVSLSWENFFLIIYLNFAYILYVHTLYIYCVRVYAISMNGLVQYGNILCNSKSWFWARISIIMLSQTKLWLQSDTLFAHQQLFMKKKFDYAKKLSSLLRRDIQVCRDCFIQNVKTIGTIDTHKLIMQNINWLSNDMQQKN